MSKLYDYEDLMGFGKYRDKDVQMVLSLDPQYLVWAHDNVAWFTLCPDIIREARSAAYAQRRQHLADVAYYRRGNPCDGHGTELALEIWGNDPHQWGS